MKFETRSKYLTGYETLCYRQRVEIRFAGRQRLHQSAGAAARDAEPGRAGDGGGVRRAGGGGRHGRRRLHRF